MRALALYLLLVFASCKASTSKEKLPGSWTTDQDESNYPKNGVSDKMTFFANDSFKVEIFWNDRLQESFVGRYTLDDKQELITTKVGSVVTESEILELTKDRLSIKQKNTKTISNYRRL
jgi:hypothetical protein